MTGALYHSGGVPTHALTLELRDVGAEEALAALKAASWLPSDETTVTVTAAPVGGDGYTVRIESAPTQRQAAHLVETLYGARVQRDGKS